MDPEHSPEPPQKLVAALSSGLAIVRYLSVAGAPVGVSRIAQHLDLNSSTCFNLLKTLDMLERERSVQLSAARLNVTPSAVSHALARLRRALTAAEMDAALREARERLGRTALPVESVSDDDFVLYLEADGAGTLMTMRMTLPDADTRAAMLATGIEREKIARRLNDARPPGLPRRTRGRRPARWRSRGRPTSLRSVEQAAGLPAPAGGAPRCPAG